MGIEKNDRSGILHCRLWQFIAEQNALDVAAIVVIDNLLTARCNCKTSGCGDSWDGIVSEV